MSLADLINPGLAKQAPKAPQVMTGEVLDVDPLRVRVPSLDGGKHALKAFGYAPYAQEGDEVRVIIDEYGDVVLASWEPAEPEVTVKTTYSDGPPSHDAESGMLHIDETNDRLYFAVGNTWKYVTAT